VKKPHTPAFVPKAFSPIVYQPQRAAEQIAQIRAALGLTNAELGRLLGGISRQAVEQWIDHGVPVHRSGDVDRIAEIVAELARRFKPQRLPQIARGKMPMLDGRSILEVLGAQGAAPMHAFFRRWDRYIPDASPIRAGDFPSK